MAAIKFILLGFCAFWLAESLQDPPVTGTCGKPEVQQSRVIAGTTATKGSWPWQILMLFNGRTMCGGSIVAPNWIVTAAHCVSGKEGYASSFKSWRAYNFYHNRWTASRYSS
eukprot:gene15873-17472_t